MAVIDTCFAYYKNTWFAFKNADMDKILSSCPKLVNVKETTWSKGLEILQASDKKAFLSGAYNAWTFLVGGELCDPERTEEFLALFKKLGGCAEEVFCFATHRVANFNCFAQISHGELIRYYCDSDQGIVSLGERTEAEKILSLNFPTNDDALDEEGVHMIDETDIVALAGVLSLAPEALLGMKEKKSYIADIADENVHAKKRKKNFSTKFNNVFFDF